MIHAYTMSEDSNTFPETCLILLFICILNLHLLKYILTKKLKNQKKRKKKKKSDDIDEVPPKTLRLSWGFNHLSCAHEPNA